MESKKILQADILDILFEDRNKEYGAYELRRGYNRRLIKSISVTGVVIGLLFVGGMVSGRGRGKALAPMYVDSVVLAAADPATPPPPPPPPPPKPVVPQVKIIAFTPPVIVPNDKADQPPPIQDDIDNAKIGKVNTDGNADDGIVAPPVSGAGDKGIVEAPKKTEEDNGGFVPVEVESTFPGGPQAWLRFLNKNLHYPDDAVNNEIQGVVTVQFIVDEKGNVSNIQAVSGPEAGGLREEAVRVIKRSGAWTPALQNGRYVKSYKRQPITFKIGNDQ